MSVLRRVHLRTLLREFKPVDAREEAHRAAMLSLCNAPGDPFSRDHWYPGHFTSSAFVLSPDDRDILLIFHDKFERWMQPGGHIEPSDVTVTTGALREVAEETGIADVDVVGEGLFDLDVHEIPARKGDPAHHHYDVRVLLRATGRELVAATDAVAARWVPLAQVDTVESDESVMRAVRKIRRVVLGTLPIRGTA